MNKISVSHLVYMLVTGTVVHLVFGTSLMTSLVWGAVIVTGSALLVMWARLESRDLDREIDRVLDGPAPGTNHEGVN